MRSLSRRAVLASGLGLLAGCVSGGDSTRRDSTPAPETDATPTAESVTATATETATPADCRRRPTPLNETDGRGTPGDRPEPETAAEDSAKTVTPAPITEIDVTLEYGESYENTALETTVERPTFDTSFYYEDGGGCHRPTGTYRMPEGRGLVFADVVHRNTHSSDFRPIDAPRFSLLADDRQIPEIYFVDHPNFERTPRTTDLRRVERALGRWTSHGTIVRSGETYETTVVFAVPEDVRGSDLTVVFRPNPPGASNQYQKETVAWGPS